MKGLNSLWIWMDHGHFSGVIVGGYRARPTGVRDKVPPREAPELLSLSRNVVDVHTGASGQFRWCLQGPQSSAKGLKKVLGSLLPRPTLTHCCSWSCSCS